MRKPADLHLLPLERQRQWARDGIPVLSMSLILPACQPASDPRLRRIKRCYEHFAHCYESYCEAFLLPGAAEAFRMAAAQSRPFTPWQAEVRYRTTLLTETVWSLLLEAVESGEGGPCRRVRADTWDLRDGYPLSLCDFFPGEPLPLRRIRRIAHREFAALAEQGAPLRPDWNFRLRTAAKRDHFYLCHEGLCFYYPEFSLGSAALGMPTVLLPWSAAGPVPPAGVSPADTLDKGEPEVLS